MSLLTDGIGFPKPVFGLHVDLRHGGETKMVDMISAGDRVDAAEAWVLQPARENDMAVNPVQGRCYLRK